MPTFELFRRCRPAMLVAAWCLAAGASQANVIVNGGFEGGIAPWQQNGAAQAVNSPVRSGNGALELTVTNGDAVALQTFAASPGQTWDLTGYLRTPAQLSPSGPGGAYFAMLKIVFRDGTLDLEPAQVNVGNANATGFPGVESLFLDASSPTNEWLFRHANGIAPAGTTEVRLFALLVSRGSDLVTTTVFVDDVQARVVPEPAPLALLAAAGLALVITRRRLA